MVDIEVQCTSEGSGSLTFEVRVRDGRSESPHEVTLRTSDLDRLAAPGERPEDFVHRCFDFLLVREPKESILSAFDVSVISRYFPEFEDEIRHQAV